MRITFEALFRPIEKLWPFWGMVAPKRKDIKKSSRAGLFRGAKCTEYKKDRNKIFTFFVQQKRGAATR